MTKGRQSETEWVVQPQGSEEMSSFLQVRSKARRETCSFNVVNHFFIPFELWWTLLWLYDWEATVKISWVKRCSNDLIVFLVNVVSCFGFIISRPYFNFCTEAADRTQIHHWRVPLSSPSLVSGTNCVISYCFHDADSTQLQTSARNWTGCFHVAQIQPLIFIFVDQSNKKSICTL